MHERTWHIRLNETEVGPLSLDELRLLAESGAITVGTEISSNGSDWGPAKDGPGLTFGPRVSAGPSMPIAPPPQAAHPTWVGVVLATVGVLLSGLLLLGFFQELAGGGEAGLASDSTRLDARTAPADPQGTPTPEESDADEATVYGNLDHIPGQYDWANTFAPVGTDPDAPY